MSTFTLFVIIAISVVVPIGMTGTIFWLIMQRRNFVACQLITASLIFVGLINLLTLYVLSRISDNGTKSVEDARSVISAGVLIVSLSIPYLLMRRMLGVSSNRAFLMTIVLIVVNSVFNLVIALGQRPFLIHAFVMPTGGMAPTLYGVHLQATCDNCGFPIAAAPVHYTLDRTAASPIPEAVSLLCPNCGRQVTVPRGAAVFSGDRFLADKTRSPKRWNLVIYNNPQVPSVRFVQRLIGLPGERVAIVGGEIVIDGKLISKTPAEPGQSPVCDDLWFPLHDTAFTAKQAIDEGPCWHADDPSQWKHVGVGWSCDATEKPTAEVLRYKGTIDSGLSYDQTTQNFPGRTYPVGDVRIDLDVASLTGPEMSALEVTRVFGSQTVKFIVYPNGASGIQINAAPWTSVPLPRPPAGSVLRLATRDGKALIYQNNRLVTANDLATDTSADELCTVEIDVRGCAVALRRIALWRDVYYTRIGETSEFPAAEGWVMLGDNTDQSMDSRMFGRVPVENFVGVVGWRYLPVDRWRRF
ncbi:MAG: hypothetical protein GC162_01580 [Planctomycetes bacterium]|nr:hypothetical protein [Planctomycetota bacterium]